MTPEQARELKAESDAVSKGARALVAGLSEAALTKAPPGGGWSVAEILQHLILTADAMLPLAEAAASTLEREHRKSTRRTGVGFMGFLLIKSLEPPPRMKTKTIPAFEPVNVTDPLTLVDRLVVANARLDALIDRAAGLATGTVKLTSPFNASVKYNLYAAFRIVLVHARRHLWQAQAVRAAI